MYLKLAWINRNVVEDGTRIYRSLSSIDVNNLPTPIAVVGPGVTEYIDDTVVRGFTYYYRLGVYKGSEMSLSAEFSLLAEPSNGPGPQSLATGDTEAGFYGEVAVADFFNLTQLRAATGFIGGTDNTISGWLKVSSRGKTLFISKGIAAITVSWNQLQAAKLVYGTEGNRVIVKFNGQRYIVRLLTGADTDPLTATTEVQAGESEWNRIMYRLCVTNPASQVGVDLAAYTTASLLYSSGRSVWCQELTVGGANACARFQSGNIADFTTVSKSTQTNAAWLPVLEHLPW